IERAPCRAREEISAGGATLKRGSGVARLPVVFEIAAELAAAERDNRIGAADGPEHPGLLEAAADDGLAASLHNPGPDKQALSPELRVAHAFGIGFEVSGFGANHIDHFGGSAAERTQGSQEAFDAPMVEFVLCRHDPPFLAGGIVRIQLGS